MSLKSLPTFHDSRYLYTGLLAFANGPETLPIDDLERRIRMAIQAHVAEQQRKYMLAEHTAVYQKIPSYIIGELSSYGLFEKIKANGNAFCLTNEGKRLLDFLLKRQGIQVRIQLAAHYLSTFTKAVYFMRRLWELRDQPGLQVPEVNYAALDPLKRQGAEQLSLVLRHVADDIAEVFSKVGPILFSPDQFVIACLQDLKNHNWKEEPKQKSFQAMRRAVDNYMLNVVFPRQEISRPKYDVLRNRGDSFGLVNQRRIAGKRLTWEHTYLTAWLIPPMGVPEGIASDDLLKAPVGEAILHVHEPRWDSVRERFLYTLRDAYGRLKMHVGYARVTDMRGDVCFKLRLASRTFDDFVKRLSEENQSVLVFSTSPERYTIKSLPLCLTEGRTYNLIRVL